MGDASSAVPKEAGPPISQEAYKEVVDAARMRDVRLVESKFSVKPEALDRPRDNWKLFYACDLIESFYDEEAKLLTGWVMAAAGCRSGKKNVLELKSKYLVVYEIEGQPQREAVVKFIERLGVMVAYPYFRSHYAENISQAGLSFPPLPVLREQKRRIAPVEA